MKTLFLSLLLLPLMLRAQVIVTVAGTGTAGYNGTGFAATATQLNAPYGVATDNDGNLYICDALNYRIRKMSPSRILTTIAGNGTYGYSGDGGSAWAAMITSCNFIAIDNKRSVYIADEHRIRKITSAGIITTIAGTGVAGFNGDGIAATSAMLNRPHGLAVDSIGNVFIVDRHNYRIRMVDTFGVISTVVGNGSQGFSADGTHIDTAKLDSISSICLDKAGTLYFLANSRIRSITASSTLQTVAGNGINGYGGDGGPATAAMIGGGPIANDTSGNIYLSEGSYDRVRKVSTDGIITTIAGNGMGGYSGDGGNPLLAQLYSPQGIAVSKTGDVYIGDVGNNAVRKVTSQLIDKVDNVSYSVGTASIQISPNPGRTQCNITIVSVTNENVAVVINNLAGMEVYRYTTVTNKAETIQTNWAKGTYIISTTIDRRHITGKLILE